MGYVASVTVALRPRLVVLAGRLEGRLLTVATSDWIAAELVWLALAPASASEEDRGPWEDAVVQRAAELGIGVRVPQQIALLPAWCAGLDHEFLSSLVDRLRLRLGIPEGQGGASQTGTSVLP